VPDLPLAAVAAAVVIAALPLTSDRGVGAPAAPHAALASRGEPADSVGLPHVRLTDSRGRRFRTSALRGGPVALGFLHTRCAVPEACPRLARLLSETQELIGTPTELRGRGRLITVTLDPAWDTPARLARYGRERGADPSLWILATGDSAALAALRKAAGIRVHGAGARMTHDEVVLVYRPDGRLFRRIEGTRWTPRELAQLLEDAVRQGRPVRR
jgi:protein SCO1/2